MHFDILSFKQKELLKFISAFKRNYYLVGGTAIALHIGHRRSIDFDLFTKNNINKNIIKKQVYKLSFDNKKLISDDIDQIHFLINDVKVTFFNYPYSIIHNEMLKNIISLPSLLTLSAMKAFTLGRRAKWKDYIDIFFIIKNYYSINDISEESRKIFGDLFSEKLFRKQLAYHDDIDFSEPVEYMDGFNTDENEIKKFLLEKSLED